MVALVDTWLGEWAAAVIPDDRDLERCPDESELRDYLRPAVLMSDAFDAAFLIPLPDEL